MENTNNNIDYRKKRAEEHLKELKGFYTHFAIYIVFVFVFIALNYFGGSNFPWAIFPILGWGLGVAGHASDTFGWNPFFGKDWEERKMREFMEKDSYL